MPGFNDGGFNEGEIAVAGTLAEAVAETPPAPGVLGVVEAIRRFWAGLSGMPNLRLGVAPRGTDFPYAVLVEVSAPVKEQTTDYQLVDGLYQISVFSDDMDVARNLAYAANRAFNKATLPASTFDAPMHCLAGEVRTDPRTSMGSGGSDAWHCYTEIEILSQR